MNQNQLISIKMAGEKEEKETDPAIPKPKPNTDQITAIIGKIFELYFI